MQIVRIPAHKANERILQLENRPAWVSRLHRNDDGSEMGLLLKRLDGPWACSPSEYITADGGHSFYRMSSYIERHFDNPIVKEVGELESDREKVAALRELCIAYEEGCEQGTADHGATSNLDKETTAFHSVVRAKCESVR
jgi:hypothetical protein